MRGATNADYNNRSQSGMISQTSSSAGSSNSATVTTGSGSYINGNVTWIFTPAIATPTITPTGQQNVCTGNGVTFTGNSTLPASPSSWTWLNFSTQAVVGTSSTYTATPSLAGNYFYVVVVSNGTCSRTSSAAAVVATNCCTAPTTGATWGTPSNTQTTQTDISFTRGNGDGGVIVLVSAGLAVTGVPVYNTTYSAGTDFTGSSCPFNDVANGQSQIGNAYVVYTSTAAGTGQNVETTITGLSPSTTYYFSIFEYNELNTCYLTPGTTGSVTVNGPCSGTPTAGTATAVSTSLCPGGSTTINLTGYTTGYGGIVFQWQQSPTGSGSWTNVSTGSGGLTPTYTTPAYTNATGNAIVYYYQCIVTCQSSTLSATAPSAPGNTITVNPSPSITINGSNTYSTQVCYAGSPLNVTLTASNSSSGTTTWSWSPSNGTLSAANIYNPVATPTVSTTYTVTASSNGCTGTATAAVALNPTAVTVTPSAPSIAVGAGVSLTASTTSTNAGTITYTWLPSDGTLSAQTGATVTASPLTSETYTVTATDGAGCSRTGTVIVNVMSGSVGQVSCGYSFIGSGALTNPSCGLYLILYVVPSLLSAEVLPLQLTPACLIKIIPLTFRV